MVVKVSNRKPKVRCNKRTRQAAADALHYLAFADKCLQHEFPTTTEQQRQALLSLSRLAVQSMLTERLTAVPLGKVGTGDGTLEAVFDLPLTSTGLTFSELVKEQPNSEEVKLDSGLLLTSPWDEERYRRALLRSGPEWRSSTFSPQRDQDSSLYLPWRLVQVDNGNHSAASGWLWGDGILKPEKVYDYGPALELIDISPDGVVRQEDGFLIGSTTEWPILALLGIGKRLMALEEGREKT